MTASAPFTTELRDFVSSAKWTFAKTYAATWPHEYIVRGRVDEGLFVRLVHHIREHGYEGKFYRMSITYFDEDGITYWTMGEPIEDTTIVNRCQKKQTYEYRLAHNLLPEQEMKTPNQGLLRTGDPRTARQSAEP
jgi:hypothetical protein